MAEIADLGNVCSEVVVGPKQMNAFFMNENRRTLIKSQKLGGKMWDGEIK